MRGFRPGWSWCGPLACIFVAGRRSLRRARCRRRAELAVFCRPVVTAPAVARRDGSVAADGWLPEFVRLGELEGHLGDG